MGATGLEVGAFFGYAGSLTIAEAVIFAPIATTGARILLEDTALCLLTCFHSEWVAFEFGALTGTLERVELTFFRTFEQAPGHVLGRIVFPFVLLPDLSGWLVTLVFDRITCIARRRRRAQVQCQFLGPTIHD